MHTFDTMTYFGKFGVASWLTLGLKGVPKSRFLVKDNKNIEK